ncbi:tetratricopeptide repeat protein [Novosphingopyxis iocasae]|uniref:tetratricopeptide repeat protein n=1 Tax=Novosphingopyxis iocasae TaxID=2762729 RepID=UPI0016512E5D|nr:tetratricopeptide repeat protein [Novosphingopyxis iocasae]
MLLSFLLAAATAPQATASVEAPQEINYDQGQLGFAAMQTGRNEEAIRQLESSSAELPNDPARLINLGNAYARMGRMEEARATLRRAVELQEHFDLVLADGRVVDSRRAAIYALDRLNGRQTMQVAGN